MTQCRLKPNIGANCSVYLPLWMTLFGHKWYGRKYLDRINWIIKGWSWERAYNNSLQLSWQSRLRPCLVLDQFSRQIPTISQFWDWKKGTHSWWSLWRQTKCTIFQAICLGSSFWGIFRWQKPLQALQNHLLNLMQSFQSWRSCFYQTAFALTWHELVAWQ